MHLGPTPSPPHAPPATVDDLVKIRGLRDRGIPKSVRADVLAAVERGRSLDPAEIRFPVERPVPAELRGAVPLLMSWVAQRARELDLPGLTDFIVQSSPRTHESRLNCPLFLFHAEDDSNVSVTESRLFAERLKGLGKDVTLNIVPEGDHYDSMIDEGIPTGIEWIKSRSAPQ